MELLSNLALGLETASTFQNLLYCFAGVLLGTLIGVLPGIGPTATVALLLPITFSLPPTAAMIMLAGIYYGSQYGGSTTAILMNLPGEAASAVTAIDGYQMARLGRAGPALAIAAIGSFVAGTFATLVIAIFSPLLTSIAFEFGPAEYCSLMAFGLICSVTLARGDVLNALAMIFLGLLLGLVGVDIYTGIDRFGHGIPELSDGINVVALAVGIFGISEILKNLEAGSSRDVQTVEVGSLMPSGDEFRSSVRPIARGTAIGTLLGVLPGGGALLSSFASYAAEKKLSKTPKRFGYGAIEGVAGPEAANNAGAQTAFIPLLTLGIPSNPVMALMAGALILQGIAPGPNVVREQPELFWGLIASMWIGNAMLVLLNLPLVGVWVKLLRVPYYALLPSIMVFSAVGVYSGNWNAFDLYALTIFGMFGYFMLKVNCEPAPLILGFVIGPMFEEYLRRAMVLSRGDPSVFITQPMSAVFIVASAGMIFLMASPAMTRKRKEIFVDD